jgi:hypothetical protein
MIFRERVSQNSRPTGKSFQKFKHLVMKDAGTSSASAGSGRSRMEAYAKGLRLAKRQKKRQANRKHKRKATYSMGVVELKIHPYYNYVLENSSPFKLKLHTACS